MIKTKGEICSETANLVASHVADLRADVAAVRCELDIERKERLDDHETLVKRVAALEESVARSSASASGSANFASGSAN